jgi:outer membrane receptor protein involved in Fe transport
LELGKLYKLCQNCDLNVPVPVDSSKPYSGLNFSYGIPKEPVVNKGTGTNYGLELTAEKFYSHDFFFLFTGSVYDSKYIALNGKKFNTVFNGHYVINALGGKEFRIGKEKQNTFGLNVKVNLRGGFRVSKADLDASQQRFDELQAINENAYTVIEPVYNISKLYEDKLPDFARLDVGIKYRRNKPEFSWLLSLDLQNITNRKNTLGYDYNGITGSLVAREGVGLMPVLYYRIEF